MASNRTGVLRFLGNTGFQLDVACIPRWRRLALEGNAMRVLFVAGFGPIVRDREASRCLYGDALGIRLDAEDGG